MGEPQEFFNSIVSKTVTNGIFRGDSGVGLENSDYTG